MYGMCTAVSRQQQQQQGVKSRLLLWLLVNTRSPYTHSGNERDRDGITFKETTVLYSYSDARESIKLNKYSRLKRDQSERHVWLFIFHRKGRNIIQPHTNFGLVFYTTATTTTAAAATTEVFLVSLYKYINKYEIWNIEIDQMFLLMFRVVCSFSL